MLFSVRVDDAEGVERRLTVRASSEQHLRTALERRGFTVRECQLAEDWRPEAGTTSRGAEKDEPDPTTEGEHDAAADHEPDGASDLRPAAGVPEGPGLLLAALDRVLEEYEDVMPLIPPSRTVRLLLSHGPDVVASTMAVLAKDVCRRISRDESLPQVLGFLVQFCGLPERAASLLVGMSLDSGRVAAAIAAEACTVEQGVRFILANAPSAEERVVRALMQWILPLVRTLQGHRFLVQLERFEDSEEEEAR